MSNLPDEKKMPSEHALDGWADDVEGIGMKYLAAFLRSPELRQAMRTLEAVEWCRKNGADITIRQRGVRDTGYGFIVRSKGNHHFSCNDTLPEAVASLRASLKEEK